MENRRLSRTRNRCACPPAHQARRLGWRANVFRPRPETRLASSPRDAIDFACTMAACRIVLLAGDLFSKRDRLTRCSVVERGPHRSVRSKDLHPAQWRCALRWLTRRASGDERCRCRSRSQLPLRRGARTADLPLCATRPGPRSCFRDLFARLARRSTVQLRDTSVTGPRLFSLTKKAPRSQQFPAHHVNELSRAFVAALADADTVDVSLAVLLCHLAEHLAENLCDRHVEILGELLRRPQLHRVTGTRLSDLAWSSSGLYDELSRDARKSLTIE